MLSAPASAIRFRRLLLTGAAGNLGRELRPRLKVYCETLRVSHRKDIGPAGPGEEVMLAELSLPSSVFTDTLRIAGFYEGKLDRALTRLTAIMGPAIMILVSMLIAWLIISVITALLSVNDLLL